MKYDGQTNCGDLLPGVQGGGGLLHQLLQARHVRLVSPTNHLTGLACVKGQ